MNTDRNRRDESCTRIPFSRTRSDTVTCTPWQFPTSVETLPSYVSSVKYSTTIRYRVLDRRGVGPNFTGETVNSFPSIAAAYRHNLFAIMTLSATHNSLDNLWLPSSLYCHYAGVYEFSPQGRGLFSFLFSTRNFSVVVSSRDCLSHLLNSSRRKPRRVNQPPTTFVCHVHVSNTAATARPYKRRVC